MNAELNIDNLQLPGIAAQRPLVISGPCSAESEEQVLCTAQQLAAEGIKILRAGVWKPRTKPGGFEGQGERALPWLVHAKLLTGMLLATEVATPRHVEAALGAGVDILWIGARTTANPFAIQELADCLRGIDVPVLVKNPINPDIELWVGALLRINGAGVKQLGAIHRGFSSVDQRIYRNTPLWHIPIELHRRYPNLPLLCDPSHIGGRSELVAPLCQQAMDMGFDGLMVESHFQPQQAWSDASQQVTPCTIGHIVQHLVVRDNQHFAEGLALLRKQIDETDDHLLELLTKRMRVSREIALYKREHNIGVVQTARYGEILDKRSTQGSLCGMSAEFVSKIYQLIHEESVRQQMEIINQ